MWLLLILFIDSPRPSPEREKIVIVPVKEQPPELLKMPQVEEEDADDCEYAGEDAGPSVV